MRVSCNGFDIDVYGRVLLTPEIRRLLCELAEMWNEKTLHVEPCKVFGLVGILWSVIEGDYDTITVSENTGAIVVTKELEAYLRAAVLHNDECLFVYPF